MDDGAVDGEDAWPFFAAVDDGAVDGEVSWPVFVFIYDSGSRFLCHHGHLMILKYDLLGTESWIRS